MYILFYTVLYLHLHFVYLLFRIINITMTMTMDSFFINEIQSNFIYCVRFSIKVYMLILYISYIIIFHLLLLYTYIGMDYSIILLAIAFFSI